MPNVLLAILPPFWNLWKLKERSCVTVMADGKKSPSERLEKMLGFDPSKQSAGSDVLTKAVEAITKERAEEALGKATDLLKQAIDLRKKRDQAERDFTAATKKFDKELGKLLNRIEALASGTSVKDDDSEGADEGEEH